MGGVSAKASAKGGKTDTDVGSIYWDDIERAMKLDEQYNRINRYGPFGGWEYDPETKSQKFVATSPGMQAAQERMDRRLGGEGFTPYESPAQIGAITDALMASRMGKMGLTDPNQVNLQQPYGQRFAQNAGTGLASGQPRPPMPPPQAPPPQAPPQQGQQAPPQQGQQAPARYPEFYRDTNPRGYYDRRPNRRLP